MNIIRSRMLIISTGVVLVALAIGTQTGAARSMGNSVLYNQYGSSVPVHSQCANLQCTDITWLPNGSAVRMLCYFDMTNQKGNYYTTRWFYVQYTRAGWFSRNFYVHASYVYYQTGVPRC